MALKISDFYSPVWQALQEKKSLQQILDAKHETKRLKTMAEEWGQDIQNVERWMTGALYEAQNELALRFIEMVPHLIQKVEDAFGAQLVGEIRLVPSLMRFDGFAMYDSGSHVVWFGVDHPDANDDYLCVLLAHELSHVYRDHQPAVWGFLGKPLRDVSRREYLDAMDAPEHLVSEGLATLWSQSIFPNVPLHHHHYYEPSEMRWCLEHEREIDEAMMACLQGDQDVWRFYEPDQAGQGSPSRIQYFWAARKLLAELGLAASDLSDRGAREILKKAHGEHRDDFQSFRAKNKK